MFFKAQRPRRDSHDTAPTDIFGLEGLITSEQLFDALPVDTDDSTDKLIHAPLAARAVFISDTHFGTLASCAREVTDFLNHLTGLEYAYLDGDIIDAIRLKWSGRSSIDQIFNASKISKAEMTVLQKILRLGRKGVRTVYLPGNHDAFMRDFSDLSIGPNVMIKFQVVHQTLLGKNLLVLHGDSFDELVRWKWLEFLGTHAFEAMAKLSVLIDEKRKNARIDGLFLKLGLEPQWSLATAIRSGADGNSHSEKYRRALKTYAFQLNADIVRRRRRRPNDSELNYIDGIVGGHTHVVDKQLYPSPRDRNTGEPIGPENVIYYNLGHWTMRPRAPDTSLGEYHALQAKYPSFTALLEYPDGRLGHVQWVPGKGIRAMTEFDNRQAAGSNPDASAADLIHPPVRKAAAARGRALTHARTAATL